MSSLRLALKQSLEDANPPHPASRKKKSGRPRGRPPTKQRKQQQDGGPRKRGRPRKHPLPENDDASSSEAEFSVSHEEEEEESDSEQELQEEEEQHEDSSDEEEQRRKRRKKEKKAMKREQQHSAAHKIQNHWKKKKRKQDDETEEQEQEEEAHAAEKKKKSHDDGDDGEQEEKPKEPTKKTGKAKTVPPPDPDLVAYMRGLSVKKQKRYMQAGLRVKVRFATKVRKRDGKVATKLKWYGGGVTRVSTGGSKIRIKYDDGTSEVSKFPDKDVIVDETGNGEHRVSAGRFIPPAQRAAAAAAAAPEEEPQIREEQPVAVVKRKPGRPKKIKPSPAKPERQVEHETAAPEPQSPVVVKRKPGRPKKIRPSPSKPDKPVEHETAEPQKKVEPEKKAEPEKAAEPEPEPTLPVKSPKKPKSPAAKRRAESSPEHNEEHVASVDEKADEVKDAHDDADAKMSEKGTDDTGDVHQETSGGSRKKLSLKIRLKGPKASIVASASNETTEDKGHHSEDEEKEHGDGSAHEEDAMEVDEQTKEERPAEKDAGDEDEQPRAETPPAATIEEANEPSDDHYARKKRTHDRVSGDGEESEEPPQKKRAEEPVVESKAAEKETEAVQQQNEPEAMESSKVVDEEEKGKVSEAVDEPTLAKPEVERKDDEEEKEKPPPSPRPTAESPTPETTDVKKSASDGEGSKPVGKGDDSMQVDSDERVPAAADGDAELATSTSKTAEKTDAPSKEVPTDKGTDVADAARAKTPPPAPEVDSRADEVSAKPAVVATIPRFGRRAAQQANERIAARKERIHEDEFAKKKKERKEKREQKLLALSPSERKRKRGEDDSGDDVDGEWVQCDNCSKWRILPSNVQPSDLPKHWYCEMNVYDPDRSSCDAPEQTAQEVLKEKRRRKRKLAKIARLEAAGKIDADTAAAQRLALESRSRKSSRSRSRLAAQSPEGGTDSGTGRGRKKRSSPVADEESAQRTESPTADAGSDPQTSRSYRKQASFGSAGRRSSKSEIDDGENAEAEVEPVPKKRGRGRPPRARTGKDAKDGDKGKGGKSGANDPDNQEWVACEKCQKWRRLPSHISADSLPDVWYCSMNTWDPKAATCDAEEDKADPNHQEFGIYGSGVSTASYGNKLSYRNLIFGTGRKQNRPITERTRAAESLFLAPTDPSSDSVSYPKVMYANSSVFMPRLSNAQKAHAPDMEKKMSLFELMNHSNLWAELRAASSMAQPDKLGSSMLNSSYDSLSDEMKQTIKDMVLHAIAAGTLARDEILLEVQCRQWTNVPQEWAEIRASCTVDKIEGAIRDLVADRSIETVETGEQTGLPAAPKYRRAQAVAAAPANKEVRSTRCMKLAKPWKKARSTMTREWCK